MSQYSGKCDLCDWIDIHDDMDYTLNKTTYYVGWHNYEQKNPLKVGSIRTLMPYYPHLIVTAVSTKDHASVVLTEESFVDTEERERLGWILKDILKYYKKCKRTKTPYDKDEAYEYYVKHAFFGDSHEDIIRKLIERVADDGVNATTYGLHLPFFDYERNKLNELMVEYDKEHKEKIDGNV